MRPPLRRPARRSARLLGIAAGGLWLLSCGDNLPPRMDNMMTEEMPPAFTRGAPAQGRLVRGVDRATAAVVDSLGKTVYLAGRDADGAAQIFALPVDGGSPQVVATTATLEQPSALALDQRNNLYVADFGSDDGGALYKGAAGGALSRLGGASVRSPAGLAVATGGSDLYVTGRDPSDDQPAVFKVSTTGGSATVVVKGEPLSQPSGIAFSNDGVLYVLDATAADGAGAVLKIEGGKAEIISKAPLAVGFPAGLSASGQSDLLVASNEPGAARVLRVTSAGEVSKLSLTGDQLNPDGDPATVYQANRANVWVALDTATPPQTTPGAVAGSVLIMTP